ncbi:Sugar phosphotransferase [Leptospira biflexa serovar Patoc strain 'Patoc 1 (Ames)']|uniref:Putative phospho-N-acetylmuramoyl-pentapeptide-transferase, glycosyltransferase family 4 n=1 Tax=Leptospira biflexa serovar Patoc (strain Patoc 1 / ATCC 23582 / Paris) TaxID=456481 RepID=B0SL57_LEPBP|nr:glycosyltransferase family 4 protein [Leptospira biflexa]ABZ93241.1 Sugar phosphotransferase [Leptospira biflexa serovar Patoc strain 'Patoc 1 (Ames)']ABZ96864.1 Putative phospho-N-acetylmuramoyl-pentapeptide-transferase, glycosyltransferase family 4 [Leptospira biflexa serovar Patoc strain 'Patoc 1 (Paris)']
MVPFFPVSLLFLGLFSLFLHSIYVHSRFGVKDVPNERSLHDTVTKKSGGMFFIPLFLVASLLFHFNPEWAHPLLENPSLIPKDNFYLLLVGIFIFSILGFVDDLYHLTPKLRLVLEFGIVFICLWGIHPTITAFGFVEIPWVAEILFLTIFLVFGINLVNFMDGMDWYLVLTFFICFFSIGLVLPNFYSIPNFGFSLYVILLLSMFGFIVYNFPKAKLFMGDSGSLALGFFVLVLPLLHHSKLQNQITKEGVFWDLTDYFYLFPFFWIDGITILIKRFLQKKHLFQAHREHLYQKLTETKLGKIGSLFVFSLLNGLVLGLHFLFHMMGMDRLIIFIGLFLVSLISYGLLWVWTLRKNLA